MKNRKFLFLVIIYVFIFWGLFSLQGDILLLAIPFVIYLSIGLFNAPGSSHLQVERVIEPERSVPGMLVNLNLKIKNIGQKGEILSLQDINHPSLEMVDGNREIISFLRPNETVELNYVVKSKRGIYLFDHLKITNLGIDSLFEFNQIIPTPGELLVLPAVPKLKRINIRSWQTKIYSGNIPSRASGFGTDFFGVRSYQPGDPLRYINWRISARHPEFLFSNEFERERVTDVWIILDGRQRSNLQSQNGELFEQIILSGAGLAQALLQEGNRVGLLVYGGYLRWAYPGYGKIQRERIMRTLAQSKPGDLFIFSDLENLPTRAFPLSSQLILVSPLHAEDIPILINLRARGYAILVISPDPIKFEKDRLSLENGGVSGLRVASIERQLHIRRLANAGIKVIDWDVRDSFERTIQSNFRIAMRKLYPMRLFR